MLNSQTIFELSRDAKIEQASNTWQKKARLLLEAQEEEKKAKESLIAVIGEVDYEGNGVKVALIERKGSVDYNKVPELKGVDLEAYRKESTSYWSVKPSLRK